MTQKHPEKAPSDRFLTQQTVKSNVAPESVKFPDGEVGNPSGELTEVEEPWCGEVLTEVRKSTEGDVSEEVKTAREATKWAEMDASERAGIMRRFESLVMDHWKNLVNLTQYETGKARRDATEDILGIPMVPRYYAATAEEVLADEEREAYFPTIDVDVRYEPYGVVGVITPWNYPPSLMVLDAIPALMAGNRVVAKPAMRTPITAIYLGRLLHKAGVPEDAFRLVIGEVDIGKEIVQQVDYVNFTGSTRGGRQVAQAAGKRLVPYSLELGGNNAAVITDDVDIEDIISPVARGCYANMGQLCLAHERIVVHEDIYEEFKEAFVDYVSNWHTSPYGEEQPLKESPVRNTGMEVASLINGEHFDQVVEKFEDAVDAGATVLTGGGKLDIGPHFFEPTVLENVPETADARCDEVFGPVTELIPVKDDAEAISIANNTEQGLHASVWCNDTDRGREIANEINAGSVSINGIYITTFGSMDAPMGGFNDSGIGRRNGPEGLLRFTRSKTVGVNKAKPLSPPENIPDSIYHKTLKVMNRWANWLPGTY